MAQGANPAGNSTRKGALEPRQQRSVARQGRIAEAAIAVIGRDGTSRLTHRSVAREAAVSLAATTYYYETRQDIIADASARLLDRYIDDGARLRARTEESPGILLCDVAARVVAGALGRRRLPTLAWCEIMLDCARHPEGHDLARRWYDSITEIWLDLARSLGTPDPERTAVSAIDTLTGVFFTGLPLGLAPDEMMAALRGSPLPGEAGLCASVEPPASLSGSRSQHGDETRQRILEAAIAVLVEDGPGGLTLRRVASRAEVAAAAPSYYFATVGHLLTAAQASLFEGAKDRYRLAMAHFGGSGATIERLVDLTSAVFLREATEYRAVALAGHPARLEAARARDLRPMVRLAVDDQTRAWNRRLQTVGIDAPPGCGLLLQCLFLGMLVRQLATGASTRSLAEARPAFAHDLAIMAAGTHWARKWYTSSI